MKDIEEALNEELSVHFVGHGQRLAMMSKLVMAVIKMGTGDKEYFILLSDEPLAKGGRLYAERWGIEVFFGSLKTRGFNFEDTHLKALERIDAVMFILAIAFVWCLKTGEYLLEKGASSPAQAAGKAKSKTCQHLPAWPRPSQAQTAQLFELIS